MARRTLPLLSQKQVDQAIKNFIVEPNPKSTKVRLCLNGGTAKFIRITFVLIERKKACGYFSVTTTAKI